ncbi:HlyD family secretion protein [Rhodoblastus sp. 17X3]|uniref:HlyD family secretion protein n=1 Tax=Rhodoblastus sp. 17X3 TaxID=3047026 RepID=UPI0024B76E85|nr:HlyD family secretion protein [Rhodoblastus sp. 17X3]MDI9848666.1 HlyD family secretion protein [Rhodoblastus sp. 17X3]
MSESSSRPQEFTPSRDSLEGDAAVTPSNEGNVVPAEKLARLWSRGSSSQGPSVKGFSRQVFSRPIPAGLRGSFDAPAGADEICAGTAADDASPSKFKQAALVAAAALAFAYAGMALSHYISVGRFVYSTDNAYVRTDLAIVSPKISGYVEQVPVIDNQHVRAGQLLARIDSGDYQLAVDMARHKVQTQEAAILRIKAQADAQSAAVAQAEAQIDAARAEVARSEAELGRVRSLAASSFASKQRYDQSIADRDKANAALAGAQAQLAGARANLVVLQSSVQEAEHVRAELAIAATRAERDLGFTDIKAPFDGTLGNRVVEPGQYVQPGARLLAIAPDGHYYVEANFKETQLDRLAPGQKALVHIDAYDGKEVEGVVESIAPASGSEFSLLPPENATGNFTKITQRFPVRIRLATADGSRLRAGMSVVVDVDTRSGGGSE